MSSCAYWPSVCLLWRNIYLGLLHIFRCKLVYTGWINNKVLLYSTGNYIQYPVINQNGKEYIYMYN